MDCKPPTVQRKHRQTPLSPFLLPQPVSTFALSAPPHDTKHLHTTPPESLVPYAPCGTLRIANGAVMLPPLSELETPLVEEARGWAPTQI